MPAQVQLRVSNLAEVPYPCADLYNLGMSHTVRITSLSESHAQVQSGKACARPLLLPRSVILLPVAGVGVLAHAAAHAGTTRLVGGLVARGLHLGVADADYNTLLHVALSQGHDCCAAQLIQMGAVTHPRATNRQQSLPTALCECRGLTTTFRQLVPTPGDRDIGAVSGFPLMSAARAGNVAEVVRLLGRGVGIDEQTPGEGCSALSLAAENGNFSTIQILIAARGDPDCRSGNTPDPNTGSVRQPSLQLAAMGGHFHAVHALLAGRADPDAADSHGRSPVLCAADFGSVDVLKALLAARASPASALTKSELSGPLVGCQPLMEAAYQGHIAVCRLLLDAGADVAARNVLGATAAHWAAIAGKGQGAAESAIPMLVDAGADVNDAGLTVFPIIQSITPLIMAASFNNAAELEVLLEMRANLSQRGRFLRFRGTALDFAVRYKHSAAQVLLQDA